MSRPVDRAALGQRLRSHVIALARTPRAPGSPAHRQAGEYVRKHLEEAGCVVEEASFHESGFRGTNWLTRPIPDDPALPLFIVGAHYDSVPASPGADDNASAVAALLELAAWIRPQLDQAGSAARLQLAAYDLEEYGLIGSFLHSRDVQRAAVPLRGMLSLEMLAYTDARPGSQRLPPHLAALYPDVANFIAVCGNEASQELVRTVTEAMRGVPGLPVEFIAVPGNGEALAETRLSDHSSFWDRGFPALMITDTSFFRNPHYHRASDTPETLDYRFLAKVTEGVGAAVLRVLRGQST